VYIYDSDTLIRICEEGEDTSRYDKIINIARFIDRDILHNNRQKLKFADKCAESLLLGALENLSQVKKIHDSLEEIYIGAMDFSKNDILTSRLKDSIFNNKV
jgi:hypothetical protein